MADLHLTEGHNGAAVSAAVGDTITVTVPENPTTGFRWALAEPQPALLIPLSNEFAGSAPDRAGAGGTRTLRYTATAPGHASIALQLVRPWEPDAPRARFRITIDITR